MNKKLLSLVWLTSLLALLLPFALLAQEPEKPKSQQPMGGVSTGAATTYTSRRTVGITDPNAPVIFEDVTDKTSLAAFRPRSGEAAKDYIFDTPSGGVAIFDYDSDARPDLYLIHGSPVGAMRGKEKAARAALYRNLGNWKFEDVTDKVGVANERWGFSVRSEERRVGQECRSRWS